MSHTLLNLIAMLLYFIAASVQGLGLKGRLSSSKTVVLLAGGFAVILHGYLLHHWIDVGVGQNLTSFNMLSLVAWLISTLILLIALIKPVEHLGIFIFPVAGLSIMLVQLFPASHVIDTAANPSELVHILLSVFTFSVLCVAALQGILLAIQDRRLHFKNTSHVTEKLPPLEVMESLMFQLIWLGFLLLSVLLVTSFYSFYHRMTAQLIDKSILVILSWGIFAVLLVGRHLFGWRGRKAIYSTLSGVGLLVVVYFGSELVMGLLS